MTLNVLYPDAQFDGEPTIEAQVFGARAALTVYRPNQTAAIPDATWQACDAIVCYHDLMLDEALVPHLRRCRMIVRAGVGYDQIAIAACAAHGIPVCNTPDYGTTDVADHAIALTLALARGIVGYHTALKTDIAAGWDFMAAPTVRRLSGQVFGVVGLGRIGTATALRAKALGMQVMFFDPYRPTGTELALGLARLGSLDELLAVADVVSLHTPLSDETRGMIDRAAVARMKPGMLLVNTSRGPVVDPDAVLDGLRSGRLAGAALDVLPVEPPVEPVPELLRLYRAREPWLEGRLVVTPHAAWLTPESEVDTRRKSAETMRAALLTNRPQNVITPEMY